MKAEQACRFRLDEGYCIFAKSPGLKPEQEEALGDVFNSAMNNMFPKTGDSILSCALGKNDAFLARNTLRTDILGRKTIFTHAYIVSAAEYARLMEEDPLSVLGVDMASMLESQSPGVQLPQLELRATVSMDAVEALFEKYQLNAARYGQLLLGAYQAMTSNSSLRLVTNRPLEQTGDMVRELTLCILDGLLPVLRGKVSFSSGADTRMKISVVPAGDRSVQSGDILFGVDDHQVTNIRPRDEVTAMAFDALGRASHQERRQAVVQMQQWLTEVVNVQEGLSVMLVAAAYCLSSGRELGMDTLLMLFRSISSAKGISNNVVNSLLADLVRRMNELGCTSKALSQIAGWYLRDSTPIYRAEADKALGVAPAEICVALVEAVFQQEMTDNVRLLLKTLLRRIPTDCEGLTGELKNKVVLWILGENVEEFIDYATVLMVDYNDGQLLGLAKGILAGSRGRQLSEAEDAMLAKALRHLAAIKGSLTREESALLDGQSPYYSDALMTSALDYLFEVRLSGDGAVGLDLVDRLAAEQPNYFLRILRNMTQGRAPQVWELYQARSCFLSGMTAEVIAKVLAEENKFENPGGPFERKAAEHWLANVQAEFAVHAGKAQLSYYSDVIARRWMQNTAALNISRPMQAKIGNNIAAIFWESVTYDQIYENDKPILERLRVEVPQAEGKLQMLDLCLALRQRPDNAQLVIDLVTREDAPEDIFLELKKCAGTMLFALLKDCRFLSWDLALLSCWERGEKETGPDLDSFIKLCEKLDRYFERQQRQVRKDANDSILLRDEKLRKAVCRLGNDLPDSLLDLVDQLKPQKAGFLGLFGGQKEKKEDTGRKERKEDAPRRGSRTFDPADYDDTGRKGKKK